MATMDGLLMLVLSFVQITDAGEWCVRYDDDDDWFDSRHETKDKFYCGTGCCGSPMERHCCIGLSIASIIWIVIGCVSGVAIIIGSIIAMYCCCRRQRGVQGRVIDPAAGMPMSTLTTATAFAGPATALGYAGPGGGIAMASAPLGNPTYPALAPVYPGPYDVGFSHPVPK